MLPIWRSCEIEQYGVLVATTSVEENEEQPVSESSNTKTIGKISSCISLPLNQLQVDHFVFVRQLY